MYGTPVLSEATAVGRGVQLPDAAGVYRACYFTSHANFVGAAPAVCSEPFSITESSVDACGVCQGGNLSCAGCDGVPYSGLVEDGCGVCDGDGTSCLGCDLVPHSGLKLDACGLCGGEH